MHDSPMAHPHPDVTTYREGAYVIDTRSATLAQVLGPAGAHVRVAVPGGGRQWEVPSQWLRLATRVERETAGVRGSAPRSAVGCTECTGLEAARREAVAGGDEEAVVDATIAVRSHFRDAHLLPGRAW
ncbi:hypothetical protein [Streptomyces cinnamoneus]|uniref:Uncharacterized protein n=1 Tax=Streptomyces cinnamoneus TaxID=53446 RepID=A0A918WRR6_STRCJ|nr:hypothetical protein [Streptomyces cinnamoneus]GHC75065.1 hypothetical protein GCM10010507_63100 [Streptomyces cinnamoneus]